MGSLYFDCNWLIKPLNDYMSLFGVLDLSTALDCRFILRSKYPYLVRQDGCHIIACTIEAPSQKTFETWTKEVSSYIELYDFQNSAEKTQGWEMPLENIPNTELIDFETMLSQIGQYNMAILERTALWAAGSWDPHQLTNTDMDQLLNLISQWDWSLYYEEPHQAYLGDLKGKWFINLLARVPFVDKFDISKSELSKAMGVMSWHWLYNSTKTGVTPDLTKVSELKKEQANEFRKLAKRYSELNQQIMRDDTA